MMEVQIPKALSPDDEFKILIQKHHQKIETGSSRDIYLIENPCCVVKATKNDINVVSNWIEVAIYNWTEEKEKFAEVYSFSSSGKYLVMEKLDTTTSQEALNAFQWPDFITDRKPDNIGMDKDGKCKLLDYAFPRALNAYKSDFV